MSTGVRGNAAPSAPSLTAADRVLALPKEKDTLASVAVSLPAPLHRAAGGSAEVAVEGETVAAALASLRELHPAVARLVLDEANRPRRGVSLFRDGIDLRNLHGLGTRLEAGDRIAVVLLMAGG